MLRNKSIAKEILEIVAVEDGGGGGLYREEIHAVYAERYPNHEPGRVDALDYHLHLLETAGFVKLEKNDQGREHDNFEMTWDGHDFIEAN